MYKQNEPNQPGLRLRNTVRIGDLDFFKSANFTSYKRSQSNPFTAAVSKKISVFQQIKVESSHNDSLSPYLDSKNCVGLHILMTNEFNPKGKSDHEKDFYLQTRFFRPASH